MEAPTPDNQEKSINCIVSDKKYKLIFSSTKNDLTISCEILETNEIFENKFYY